MKISFDPVKRDWTLRVRGLAFDDTPVVFAGPVHDEEDVRFEYGERRFVTYGFLQARLVVIVWTLRGDIRHIISMRKANAREIKSKSPRVW